ncbi:hypothetical protein [Hymenobacter sp. APR13]|uniref:hypothetical protein n=1 Tax=Hymenobacter sp. APR13 TaxID=1356852 RepID=UPI0012E05BC5|nr:hypothetical protein [Hymenobacter sp. APR13]
MLVFLFLLPVQAGFAQEEVRRVRIFTPVKLQQFAELTHYPSKYLRTATYYADSSFSLFYSHGATDRKKFRTAHSYSFFSDGKRKSRSRQHVLGFGLRCTKRWNETGQLEERYRRNQWPSTSYTYASRRFTYANGRMLRKDVEKAESGCFYGRMIKRKLITFTNNGRIVTFSEQFSLGNDSISTR